MKSTFTFIIGVEPPHWLKRSTNCNDSDNGGKNQSLGISNFDVSDLEELWQLQNGPKAAANEDLFNLGSRGVEYSLARLASQA